MSGLRATWRTVLFSRRAGVHVPTCVERVRVRASLRRGTESWEMSAKLVECILVTNKETVV